MKHYSPIETPITKPVTLGSSEVQMLTPIRFSRSYPRTALPLQLFRSLVLFLCAPVLHHPLFAQLSTTATITGTVTDSAGAIVPDATVTIVDEATKTATIRQ